MSKDVTEKRLEEFDDVFVDIFNNLLFAGEEILHEDDLISLPTESYVRKSDGKIHQNNRDVRKADKENNVYRLVCGLENQTGQDNTMPERVMGYDYAAYEAQIKEIGQENEKLGRPAYTKRIHNDQKLAPVVTGVLYWGSDDWKGPKQLHDMIRFPKEKEEIIKPLVSNYSMNLIEVSKLSKEVREKLTSDFRLIAEYFARKKDKKALKELFTDNSYKIKHPEEFLDVLSEVASDGRYKMLKEKLKDEEKKGDLTMCIMVDELLDRGRQEGRQEGRLDTVCVLVRQGLLKLEEAAVFLGMSVADMQAKLCEENT